MKKSIILCLLAILTLCSNGFAKEPGIPDFLSADIVATGQCFALTPASDLESWRSLGFDQLKGAPNMVCKLEVSEGSKGDQNLWLCPLGSFQQCWDDCVRFYGSTYPHINHICWTIGGCSSCDDRPGSSPGDPQFQWDCYNANAHDSCGGDNPDCFRCLSNLEEGEQASDCQSTCGSCRVTVARSCGF